MAFRQPANPPPDVDEANGSSPVFPPLAGVVNPNKPSASDIVTQIFPYRRYARGNAGPNLVLRAYGQPETDQPADPTQPLLQSIARSLRLIAAPWLTPPPDAESFHLAAGIGLTPNGDGIFYPVVTITCPPGRNGVLNEIANVYVGGGFTDYSGAVIWQIQRNSLAGTPQSAERNYENIVASLGTSAAPGKIAPIRLFENDVISLVVTNKSIVVAGQFIGGLLGGWFYPRTWDDQFDREDQSLSW